MIRGKPQRAISLRVPSLREFDEIDALVPDFFPITTRENVGAMGATSINAAIGVITRTTKLTRAEAGEIEIDEYPRLLRSITIFLAALSSHKPGRA